MPASQNTQTLNPDRFYDRNIYSPLRNQLDTVGDEEGDKGWRHACSERVNRACLCRTEERMTNRMICPDKFDEYRSR